MEAILSTSTHFTMNRCLLLVWNILCIWLGIRKGLLYIIWYCTLNSTFFGILIIWNFDLREWRYITFYLTPFFELNENWSMRLEIGHSTPLNLLSIALFPGLNTTPERNIEKIDVKYILRYIWLIQCHLWTIIWILCNTFERSTVYWYCQYFVSFFHNSYIFIIWDFRITYFWKLIYLSL